MSGIHLILSCLTAFVVTNYPEPMETLPALLVGVICGILGLMLSKRDESAQPQDTAEDDNQ